MPADGPDIIKRYNRWKQDRHTFDQRWAAMAPFIAPSREGIMAQPVPGQKQGKNVYDSTTMMAAETLAMFLAGQAMNPSQQWFGLRMHQPELNEIDEVREWLEETRDRMLQQLSNSLFYAEGSEPLVDYTGFGTGSLLIEENPQPVNRIVDGFRGFYIHADKIGRFVLAEGPDGQIDTEMREFRLTARIASARWGKDNMPEAIQKAMAVDGDMDKMFTFIHAVYPRSRAERAGKGGALGFPWVSAWVALEAKKLVFETGYRVFPFAVPRYQRTPGEVYGRGRGDLAFADTWTLNTAKRLGLEDLALKTRPPILTRHDSVLGTLRLVPAGATSINTHGQRIQDVIMPYQTGSHPEISMIKEEELRQTIREIFFIDPIRQLLQVSKSEMTAFEFSKKFDLLFQLLGPVYGRLEGEYLKPIVDISFDVMLEAGEFSDPPAEVQESDGAITVEYLNPIAKAQRAGETEGIALAINDLAPLAEMFPQVMDRFDPDRLSALVFNNRGVPAKVTRTDQEMEELREARAEQDQAQLALEQAEQASKVVKNVGSVMPAEGAVT